MINDNDINDLLVKYIAAETSPEEAQKAKDWLSQSAENRRYFEELTRVWNTAALAKPQPVREVDTEAALQKVKTQLRENARGKAKQIAMFPVKMLLRMAAALALVLAAVWFWQKSTTNQPVEIATTATSRTDTLTDGSVVSLNRNSGLSLSPRYGQKGRQVQLTGEAFFEVEHNAEQPFSVTVQEVIIRDIGTKFNVDNQTWPRKVVVTVTEGVVEMQIKDQKRTAKAGETLIADLQSGQISLLTRQDENVLAYKTRIFSFDAVPLKTVVEQLSKVYNVQITLKNPQLEHCQLTARFDNLPLERVLELIKDAFSLQIERKPEQIRIDGTCE